MVPCRCAVLNTLRGDAAEDYARRHLDEVRETTARTVLRCPETDVEFVLEAVGGGWDPDRQRQLRRTG